MKVLVKEGFKGFLFKKGKFIKMVDLATPAFLAISFIVVIF